MTFISVVDKEVKSRSVGKWYVRVRGRRCSPLRCCIPRPLCCCATHHLATPPTPPLSHYGSTPAHSSSTSVVVIISLYCPSTARQVRFVFTRLCVLLFLYPHHHATDTPASIVLVGASPTLCRSAVRCSLVHNAFLGRCPALFSGLSLLCLSTSQYTHPGAPPTL